MLKTDGNDYYVIKDACVAVNEIEGLVCELGSYQGGGLKLLMETFSEMNQRDRIFLSVDPYGDIPYHDINGIHSAGYTNNVKNMFLRDIHQLSYELNTYFLFFNMTDTQFFKRFSDGIPVYINEERIYNKYALVIIDGPHEVNIVKDEFDFFKNRISTNGIIVFDDVEQYPHETIHEYILQNGFETFKSTGYKHAYKKVV
jgi:hypothetical protein